MLQKRIVCSRTTYLGALVVILTPGQTGKSNAPLPLNVLNVEREEGCGEREITGRGYLWKMILKGMCVMYVCD